MSKNLLLKNARKAKGWGQKHLADFAVVSLSTIERAERGEPLRIDNIERISRCLGKTPEELGLFQIEFKDEHPQKIPLIVTSTNKTSTNPIALLTEDIQLIPATKISDSDLLSFLKSGVRACEDLYYGGSPYQVEVILPLYCKQSEMLAHEESHEQEEAGKVASEAYILRSEIAADRSDFQRAILAGKKAFMYGQLGNDTNLQIAALISLGNISFHQRNTKAAIQSFKLAIYLFEGNEEVTPLLKGRTYVGIAETYALEQNLQEATRAMGLAYEYFPLRPEEDPAYRYIRASRYAL
ncbi:MAG: helix-turn-helix transcriptional regulator, partial [Ktedonobacteraceae bacterium]|nr:helix-turn-helix transcriptional regulator [Ktedonobacteraceae bacterium]